MVEENDDWRNGRNARRTAQRHLALAIAARCRALALAMLATFRLLALAILARALALAILVPAAARYVILALVILALASEIPRTSPAPAIFIWPLLVIRAIIVIAIVIPAATARVLARALAILARVLPVGLLALACFMQLYGEATMFWAQISRLLLVVYVRWPTIGARP
jgi:hypothetical protein